MPLAAGTALGPYQIIGPLGVGGMGEVYSARDERLGRTVALKVLPETLTADPDRLQRFALEARAASALNHPNIITVYDVVLDGARPYIALEFIEGRTLRAALQRGPVPLNQALTWATQIADGLAKAHDGAIVHRDLKPENLMVSNDGFVKILDFGLAKLVGPAPGCAETRGPEGPSSTLPGMILGTAGYMSPEQATGGQIDFRSDQFSFGSVLYELLTGRPPFERPSFVETQAAIVKDDPIALGEANPSIPLPLRWIVARCLAKDPDERYGSTRDLARDLATLRAHVSNGSPGIKTAARDHATRSRRHKSSFWLGLAGGLLAGAGLALMFAPAKVADVPLVRYLTYSGHDGSPAVSSDGRLIAFSSDRDGRRRIWLKQVTGGAEAAVTEGDDDYPRVSPDGSLLLFVRNAGTTSSLYRVPTLGGEPRKILDDVVDGDWSPDGRQIAFIRWQFSKGVASSAIWIVDADGGQPRHVRSFDQSQLVHPRWSPDGQTIAAVTRIQQAGLPHRILLVDADAKRTRTLSPVPGIGGPSAVAWSGDGRAIVYLQAASVGGHATGSAARLIRQDVVSGDAATLMWSPNSGFVLDILSDGRAVFDGRSPRENLQEVPLTAVDASPRWLTRGTSSDRQPVYSPDGDWIVFTSNRSDNLDLWLLSTRNGTVRPLTDDAAEDWDPSFSRDGKKLLWSSNRSGHFEIWMADADGSAAMQVTHDGVDAENPTTTADGTWIIYNSSNPAHPGVWKIRSDGSEPTRLVSGLTLLPEVSPDGRYVLYLTDWRTQRPVIRVVETAEGHPVPFSIEVHTTKTFLDVGRARWMHDGSIAFLGENAHGVLGIFAQAFSPGSNTTASRRALAGFDRESVTESFGLSSGGARLTVARWEQLSSIMSADGLTGITPANRSR